MKSWLFVCSAVCCGFCIALLTACAGLQGMNTTPPPSTYQLTVTAPAAGTGTITSNPSGIQCPSQCSANFAASTRVTLTETPGSNYFFEGWSGACSGSGSCTVTMTAATSVSAAFTQGEGITVAIAGGGSGTVTSSPSGINCPTTCSASYAPGTQLTLTETAATGNTFSGWSGSCTGPSSCTLTLSASDSVTATFVTVAGVQNLNHIIFIAQENRSFDEYFGYLRQYWANNGIPDQSFDGLPQFNPTTGAPPLQGPVASNPPCSFTTGYCTADPNGTPVPTFHMQSICTEDMSPFWNESHVAWNAGFDYPTVVNWLGNGFVQEAANEARQDSPPINDTNGYRAMGYFTDQDLNYYYFMATNFATSDRWFSPVMTRTQANRAYIMGATSQGYVYPLATQLTSPPIFEALQNAGITWKDYVNTDGTECSGTGDALSECLLEYESYLSQFTYENTILNTAGQNPDLLQNIVPLSQFTTDAQNGTLPQVAMIEPASSAALDEHPSDNDSYTVDIQAGANYIAGLINTLMTSQSWHDSAMIFTYDEAGGFYDHVQPQPVPVPDSYTYPRDLQTNDLCLGADQSTGVCSLAMTGYRIPLIVISPYAKKNYVSHTVRDTTAWLSLVEERFNLQPLNARDGYWLTEKDATTGLPGTMDEFFDFQNPPWMTPPSPPTQYQGGACTLAAPNPFGGG